MPWHHFAKEEKEFNRNPRGGGIRSKPKCQKCGLVLATQKAVHEHKMDVHSYSGEEEDELS